jgi:hypothetical protein
MSCQPQPKRSRTTIGPSDAPDISLSPRDDEFSSTSWWLVDVESNDVITQGATPLVKRCIRVYGWDLVKTRKVLKAYRQFLFLKKQYEDWDGTKLSPCTLVDEMWQQHILDVVNYCHDMMLLCGCVLGYNPDETLDDVAKFEKTREGLELHFKNNFDEDIWLGKQDEERVESDVCDMDEDIAAGVAGDERAVLLNAPPSMSVIIKLST